MKSATTRRCHAVHRIRTVRVVGLIALAATFLLGAIYPIASKADPAGYYVTITLPSARQAELYRPPHLSAHPQLWVILHGANEQLEGVEDYGFGELADQSGDLVVYPEGWKEVWDAGTCCFSQQSDWPNDVDYLNQVVAYIQHRYPSIAPGIRAVGFSNGGMMAYTWACQQPKVTAVAAVAGAWTSEQGCDRSALTVHNIHAVSDEVVPYYGGPSAVTRTEFESQEDLYKHFPAGSNYQMHTLVNGGHGWPADATEEIWQALH